MSRKRVSAINSQKPAMDENKARKVIVEWWRQEQKKKKAATDIQAWYKGELVREALRNHPKQNIQDKYNKIWAKIKMRREMRREWKEKVDPSTKEGEKNLHDLTVVQANIRRFLAQKKVKKMREEKAAQKAEWTAKWNHETSPEKGESGAKVLRGVIDFQAGARRRLAQKKVEKMRAELAAQEAEKAAQEAELAAKNAAIRKELLEKRPNGDKAATAIQNWWRGERERIAAGIKPKPQKKVNIQQIIKDHNLLERRKKTRYIDRSQLAAELTPAGQGNPPVSLVYDPITKTFNPAKIGQNRYQGQWIDGIFGHYNGGIASNYFGIREVEVEETAPDGTKTKKKIRVDANGKELDPSQPLSRVGRDGKLVQDDQFMLGSLGRSRANANDVIELGPEGIPIAEFESSIALQAAVNEVRERIRMANLPSNGRFNPAIGFDEVRCAFARYKHQNYNERKEYIGSEDRYVMLIETRQGLTEVFVEDNNILNRIAEAEKTFMDDKTYRTMISAALKAHEGIADIDERIAKAEQTVRQEIRNKAMQKIAQEVQEAQNQSRATQQFNDRDFQEIALAQGKVGEGADDLRKRITRIMRNVPTPISNYVDHGGVAIQKNRRGAHITFNGAKPNDVFWMNYPGTSYYARVACAPESGLYEVFEDGQSKFVFRKKGETWMDKNTIHYHDGANYVPLMVHTNTFGANPQNTLANHQVAKYQGGYKGYKGIQQMYDNFAIQVSSQIDEVRSIAIKVKGEPVISTVLKPAAFQDRNGDQLKFVQNLPDPQDIADNAANLLNLHNNFKTSDLLAKHPVLTSLKGVTDDDPKIEAALKRIYDAFGNVYSRVSLAGDNHDNIDPQYKDFDKWRPIASDQGAFYRDRKLYGFDPRSNQYFEITQEQIVLTLMAQPLLNNKGEATNGYPLSQEEANKYSRRFIAEISEMEVRDFTISSEAKNLESKLRYSAMQGDIRGVGEVLDRYQQLRQAIEQADQTNPYTSEEKAAIYGNLVFDIDARDPKTGKTALHLAAELGKGDVVKYLLAAGANPLITTNGKKPQTARDLAVKAGMANSNDPDNFVLKLGEAENKKRSSLPQETLRKLTGDANILRSRADGIKQGLDNLSSQLTIMTNTMNSALAAKDTSQINLVSRGIKNTKSQISEKQREYDQANKKAEAAEKKAKNKSSSFVER